MRERLSRANAGRFSMLLAAVVLFVFANSSFATIIRIPTDVRTILDAIVAASTGDSIYVSPGTYIGNMNFAGKHIFLKSTDGAEFTTLEPEYVGIPIFSIVNGETNDAVIDGFRIQNATGAAGVRIENSSPIIRNCQIENCIAGIDAIASSPRIIDSRINITSMSPAISIVGFHRDTVLVEGNSISNNSGTGIRFESSNFVLVVDNYVRDVSEGIVFRGSGHGGRVSTNVICRAINGAGIDVDLAGGMDISYNTCYGNRIGIKVDWMFTEATGTSNIIASSIDVGLYDGVHHIHNSLVWNNTVNFANPPQLPNDYIEADPMFRSALTDDFSLLCGSPAIDAGEPSRLDPDGSRADIGAIPIDHRANSPVAMNFSILNQNAVQIFTNPTFVWSPLTDSTTVIHIDTLFCYFDPIDRDTICIVDTTSVIGEVPQLGYEFEAGTDDDWNTAELMMTGEVVAADTLIPYNGTALAPGQTYFARLRLRDESGWGCWRHLVFRRNASPSIPTPTSPANGSRVDTRTVVLKSQRMTDPEIDSIRCEFELFDDSLLTNRLFLAAIPQSAAGLVESDTIAGLASSDIYWWRARSYDGHDYSSWSATYSFKTDLPTSLIVPTNFATIQAAVNFAVGGDTIMIEPGTYTENINLRRKPLHLIGRGGSTVTIMHKLSNSSIIFDLPTALQTVEIKGLHFECQGASINSSGNAAIKNCHFTRLDGSNPLYPGIFISGNLRIEDCTFDGQRSCAVGGFYGGSQEVSISDCKFLASGGTQFFELVILRAGASAPFFVDITNNFLQSTIPGFCLEISGPVTGGITNNTFIGFDKGMLVAEPDSLDIRNNIFANCATTAIEAGSSIADYNAFWQNGANYAGTQSGVHDISANPLFVDPANGDYSLMCNSPCIDEGDPTSIVFSGKAIDIGAYEYDYTVGNATTVYGDASVNIADAVFLVNYIFLGGPAPCPIGAGLIDCTDVITMSDIAYLINFLYAHGPEPCISSPPR